MMQMKSSVAYYMTLSLLDWVSQRVESIGVCFVVGSRGMEYGATMLALLRLVAWFGSLGAQKYPFLLLPLPLPFVHGNL